MPAAISDPSTGEVILKDLKAEEKELIASTRQQLSDEETKNISGWCVNGDVDAVCWRYLRARKYKADKAIEALRATITWRDSCDYLKEAITFKPSEVMLQRWEQLLDSTYLQGTSKHNHVMLIDRTTCKDLSKLRKGFTEEELKTMWVMHNEYRAQKLMKECSAKSGHTIDKQVAIVDVSKIGLSALRFMSLLTSLAAIDNNHYCETMYKVVIVHAPMFFEKVWAAVSQIMDKRTIDKVKICSTNGAEEILQLADPSVVPYEYGGTAGSYEDLRKKELDDIARYCGYDGFPWGPEPEPEPEPESPKA